MPKLGRVGHISGGRTQHLRSFGDRFGLDASILAELASYQSLIVLGYHFGECSHLEIIVSDLTDRGDLSRGSCQPALLEAFHFSGINMALVHLDLTLLMYPR